MQKIDIVAALLGGVTTLLIGAIWYSPKLFGDVWARHVHGIEKPSRAKRLGALPIGFAYSIVTVVALSYFLGPSPSIMDGLTGAAIAAIGLVGTSYGINQIFGDRPWSVLCIDGGFHLLQFLAFGVLLAIV